MGRSRPIQEAACPVPKPAPFVSIRTQVREAVALAFETAVDAGDVEVSLPTEGSARIEIERPAKPEHGDFASNLGLKLARPPKSREIATAVASRLNAAAAADPAGSPVAEASIAGPGFVNLRVSHAALERAVEAVLAEPAGWGRVPPVNPRSVNVEFVSANPT